MRSSNVRSISNVSPEPSELAIAKTLVRRLSERDRDRLLTWLAAHYDVRGRPHAMRNLTQ